MKPSPYGWIKKLSLRLLSRSNCAEGRFNSSICFFIVLQNHQQSPYCTWLISAISKSVINHFTCGDPYPTHSNISDVGLGGMLWFWERLICGAVDTDLFIRAAVDHVVWRCSNTETAMKRADISLACSYLVPIIFYKRILIIHFNLPLPIHLLI